MVALPADQRPIDDTPVHTADLPPTPIRDRNIPATAWVEAPPELLDSSRTAPATGSAPAASLTSGSAPGRKICGTTEDIFHYGRSGY